MRRNERDVLLRIRAGELSYEDLLTQAEERIQSIDELFKKSDLPEHPHHSLAERILVEISESLHFN